ncbi:hypothetical protein Efla_000346 [Eimeria flavescens]
MPKLWLVCRRRGTEKRSWENGRQSGQANLVKHIPDALKTGSGEPCLLAASPPAFHLPGVAGLDTPAANETVLKLLKAAPGVKETPDAYWGAFLAAYFPGTDFNL